MNGIAKIVKFTKVVIMGNALSMTATEANRKFSALLREVEKGNNVTITSHGRDVAVISKPDDTADEERAKRLAALERLKAHWSEIKSVTVGPWTREELYERD